MGKKEKGKRKEGTASSTEQIEMNKAKKSPDSKMRTFEKENLNCAYLGYLVCWPTKVSYS